MSAITAAVDDYVSRLRCKSDEQRVQAAQELFRFVSYDLKEVPPEATQLFYEKFDRALFELAYSQESSDMKAAIFIIVCLAKDERNVDTARLIRHANYLRNMLPSTDASVMEMAARAGGYMALWSSGLYASEYLDFEMKCAFEWLQATNADKSDMKRLAAVLILKELADVTPTFFFQHVSPFFDCIFGAIKDSKPSIRENAVFALRAALVVTSQRETEQQQKDYCYKLCYEEALRCFAEAKTAQHVVAEDRMHSGLLIVNELLRSANVEWEPSAISKTPSTNRRDSEDVISRLTAPFNVVLFESKTCRTQVSENYDEICTNVLRCRYAKNIYNINIILQLLPRLAAFDVAAYGVYLADSMNYMLICASREKVRAQAFLAMGLVTASCKERIQPFLPKLMDIVRSAFSVKDTLRRRNLQYEASMFKFIALMTTALKQDAEPQLRCLIEPMLASGLSNSLISALLEIAECAPSLNSDIQDGLLRQLYQVLLRCQAPSKLLPPPQIELPPLAGAITDPTVTTLALKVLGSFNFQAYSLEVFLKQVSEGYLNCEHVEVRLESVRCITHILTPFVGNFTKVRVIQDHLPLLRLIGDVLMRLMIAGVTDEEKIIRLTVLQSLAENEILYPHLAQAELLQLLTLALQDEDYEIRELVVYLVCRLSGINPALVMPTLRRVLLQIYSELMYSGLSRNEEQSARLFTKLVSGAPKFMKPYMQSAYEILIPKLKGSSQIDVVISTLNAIGELANIVSNELLKQLNTLMPVLIEFLQDSSSYQKRKMTVWALGKIVESTGYVMKPFQDYPELLGILLRFLKTEQMREIRRETIRVLGFIGALDPYKQKVYSGAVDTAANSTGLALSMPDVKDVKDPKQEITQWFHWERCSLEEYYPALALVNLMSILSDASLSQHHTIVVNAALLIFKALNLKCLPFMDQVIPNFIKVIRTSDLTMRMFLFQQLGVLTSVVKQHIKPYLKEIFNLIKEFWSPDAPIRLTIIMLVEQLAMALGSEFKPYVADIIPPMLRVFVHDNSDSLSVTAKLLEAFQATALVLEPYFHLILPPMLKLFYRPNVPLLAIDTVDILGENMSLGSYASRIMQAVVRVLDLVPELHMTAMNLVCTLVIHMGSDFLVFRKLVDVAMTRNHIALPRYDALIGRVLQGITVDPLKDVYYRKKVKERHERIVREQLMAETELKNAPCNYMCLQRAWDVSLCISKDDWIDWLNRFSIELLKESPFPALRACHSVAQNYYPLASDLFNPAFASCWTELPENYQDELTVSLQQALSCDGSPEITQTILNLAEFLDHSDKGPLPVDSKLLGRKAIETRAYAKALRYEENEFLVDVTPEILESLISINNMLQLQEASIGVVEYARKKDIRVAIKERWYEKLHDWEKALDAYDRKQELNPNDMELTLGRMRCLEALGDWSKLYSIVKDKWENTAEDYKRRMARIAAASTWGLGLWDAMEEYVRHINDSSLDGCFYRAVLAVHQEKYTAAEKFLEEARDMIDTELTAMAAESYSRAYDTMVIVQMLSEVEETMHYNLMPEKRSLICQMWWKRLQECQRTVEDWQKFLQVRSLVLSPDDMRRMWLKFASLCRKNGKLALSQGTLMLLLHYDPNKSDEFSLPLNKPDLSYAYCKHLYCEGRKELAISQLNLLIESTCKVAMPKNPHDQKELLRLKAKCFLRLGQWTEVSCPDNEPPLPQVMLYYRKATEFDKDMYKAWHALACTNFNAVLYYKQKSSLQKAPPTIMEASEEMKYSPRCSLPNDNLVTVYAVQAVRCFFRSVALCSGNSLQETLRLLTLWFDYGQNPEVYDALMEGIATVKIETWLQVITQLIARIDTTRHLVNRLITQLLTDIGKEHPQALVYPLTVAAKSGNLSRQQAAGRVLKHLSDRYPTLVQQAALVSEELVRVAILWHELWHEGLEEASRQYFAEKNIQGMFNALDPLHNIIEEGPTTLKEQSFTQAYYRDLKEAHDRCEKYKQTANVKELTQAWDLYYHVFRRISKQLPQLTSLELRYVSPKLLLCQNSELAVPGTYDPNRPIVRIKTVHSSLQIITSKQRPRKVCIKGSDGQDYWFLLKGHEDPRQDERVMQLFGLVNTLLLENPTTCRRNLTIQRYSVIPLSQNSGLIGWVPNCDTIHALLRDYREKKKILLNIEHKLMQRMAPDYDHLTLMQKVEVFGHALEHTPGDDLQKILWLKSPSSEVWFDRRTNYTRSLATMSMVGYVLGLGDRHPSNLMLERMSGKIVHIDFGDCFEVAINREKFPEKIPFRLTRMLVNAMEVTGVEGNFRITCERVLHVLRENRESVMAVLEAFVYDPLISWRLIDHTTELPKPNETLETGLVADSQSDGTVEEKATAGENVLQPAEVVSKKALEIIQRIRDKLTGRDFANLYTDPIDVSSQVELLIEQAVSHENLCQCYIGWCPFW